MRIRSIKPEFWRSDDITALPMEIRLLFIGLWSYVDDNGVGVDDHRQIAADLFALEEDQKEARGFVREGLATLSRGLLIVRYKVNNKPYLYIRTWKLHQRVDRPGKARFPLPPADHKPPTSDDTDNGATLATPSRQSRDTLERHAASLDTGRNREEAGISDDTDKPPGTRLGSPNTDESPPQRSDQQVSTPSRHPRDTLATGTGEKGRRGTGELKSSCLPSEGDSPPARDQKDGRQEGRTEHPSPAELDATATRHGGYALVARWVLDNPGVTTAQQRKLAKAVDELLAQRADPTLIPAALNEAHRSNWRDPVKSLPSAYDRVRRDAHPSPTAPNRNGGVADRVPTTTARIAAIQALKRGTGEAS